MSEPRVVICGSHYIEVKQASQRVPNLQSAATILNAQRGMAWYLLDLS